MKKKISVAIAFSLMGICLLGFAKDEDSQKMEFVENVSTESAVEARSIKLEDDLPASTDELENTVEESILAENSADDSSEEPEIVENDIPVVTTAEEQQLETPDSENEPEPFSLIGSLTEYPT